MRLALRNCVSRYTRSWDRYLLPILWHVNCLPLVILSTFALLHLGMPSWTRGFHDSTLQNDRWNRGPVFVDRPIRRLVLLYTILGASRKSLCAHSTVIYRSEITLYSLEYLEYLDKYRLRGEDGLATASVAIRCFSSRGYQKIGVIYETCKQTRWIQKIYCFFFFFFNYNNYDKFGIENFIVMQSNNQDIHTFQYFFCFLIYHIMIFIDY